MAAAPFRRVLVANRGEIGLRLVEGCRAAGCEAVAAHSDADAELPYVRAADAAVRIGPGPAGESYLSVPRLIEAALASGCAALHPGYGFLSEQPELAEACAAAGIAFVGPSPATLRLCGDKRAARRLAVECGLAVVPGGDAPEGIPLPLLVKAAAGGGGRGMRIVRAASELEPAIAAARREAEAAFGDGTLLFERYLEGARHLEVQLLADGERAVAVGLRDCSLQRRHQKVVEEAPPPGIGPAEAAQIAAAACRVFERCAYRGAGTVELLRTRDGEHLFLEINARLQVEHPVTELTSGVDLVVRQLELAAGGSVRDDDVRPAHGHAVEARLVAEDPDHEFRPGIGPLLRLDLPAGAGIRVDAGYAAGDELTPHYDGLIAKICAHGADRAEALDRLAAALAELVVLGVPTNLPLLQALLAEPGVRDGALDTGLLERLWRPAPPAPDGARRAADAVRRDLAAGAADPFAGRFRIALGAPGLPTALAPDGSVHVLVAGRDLAVAPDRAPDLDRLAHDLRVGAAAELHAPLPGRILSVAVEEGAAVLEGDVIATLEAMKLEHVLRAPHDGTVSRVACAAGDHVRAGALVAVVSA